MFAASQVAMQSVQDIDFPEMKQGHLGLSNRVRPQNSKACISKSDYQQRSKELSMNESFAGPAEHVWQPDWEELERLGRIPGRWTAERLLLLPLRLMNHLCDTPHIRSQCICFAVQPMHAIIWGNFSYFASRSNFWHSGCVRQSAILSVAMQMPLEACICCQSTLPVETGVLLPWPTKKSIQRWAHGRILRDSARSMSC